MCPAPSAGAPGGLEAMRQLRHALRKGAAGRALKDRELCNGPSKLCQALAIDRSFDQRDLARDESVWLEQGPPSPVSQPWWRQPVWA